MPPATPFVGRAVELRRLAELLSENRVVTVVGTGGVGKSRLAMEFLASQTEREPATALLASIGPGDSVAAALAAELGVESAPDALVDAIAGRLELEPTLVVLDNCEHVRDSARELVEVLAHRVQDLRVLVTSRRRLDMPEEQLLMLEPFPLPAEPDPSAPAVQLFCDRVARAAPHLEPQPQDLGLAVDICRLLGGLPLAMELAAARVHMLGLVELRNQLVRGRLPTSTGSRTMQEAVSWSLGLLGTDARRLFAEACVFPSTFDLDALGAVSSLGDPLPALGELVDASMLSVVGGRSGRRYRILEPIRQAGSAEIPDAAAESYLEWVAGMGERVRVDFLERDRGVSIELLVDHSDDFRHGLVLLAERGEDDRFAQLALALSYPLSRRPVSSLVSVILDRCPENPAGLAAKVDLEWSTGRAEVCLAHVEQLLGMVDPEHPWVVKALGAACPAHSYRGDLGQMSAAAQRMVAHPAATDLERIEAVALWTLGELYGGDVDAAGSVLEDNADVLALGNTALVSFVRAEVAAAQESDEALGWLERGATEARQTGDFLLTRMIEVARLAMLVRESEHGDALDLALDLVPELTRAGLMPQAWMSLRHVAALLVELGEPATALLILDSAAASEDAPEVVGDAVGQEAELRHRIADDLAGAGIPGGAMSSRRPATAPVGRLWMEVEAALVRHAQLPATG